MVLATRKFMPGIFEEILSTYTYAEESISGEGIHVIGKGIIPGPKRRSGCREMYPDKRVFLITGNHIEGTPHTVNEVSEQALRPIYEKIDPPVQKSQNKVGVQKKEVLGNLSRTDEEIIELCKNAANGEKFSKLFSGNWQGTYDSQSEADLALCNLIAFRTKDFDQIDRIFRKCGLYRPKWDENEIARINTITKALKGAVNTKIRSEGTVNKKENSEDAVNTKDK